MKKHVFVKFSPIYTALVGTGAIFGTIGVQAQDVSCAVANGCNYLYVPATLGGNDVGWVDFNNRHNKIDGAVPLNLTVEAGNYQNIPADNGNNIADDHRPFKALLGLWGPDWNKENNTIHIKSGVTATLREDASGSVAVKITDATAVIEKGVNIILEKNYSQIHDNQNLNGKNKDLAISGRYDAKIYTQADILLNNDLSIAIYNNKSDMYSENHNITMNGKENVAYTLDSAGKIEINNVNITGNGEHQILFNVSNPYSHSPFNMVNSKAHLHGKNSYITRYEQYNSSNIKLSNSTISSDKGFFISPSAFEVTNSVTLDNTEIKTKDLLIVIDDSEYFPSIHKHRFELVANNQSVLQGAAIANNSVESSKNVTTAFTLNNSQWQFDKNSTLTRLALNDGKVIFQPTSNTFNTLTLRELSGSGTFVMNTDLANQQADKITVQGVDSGAFGLSISDSGNEPNEANGKVTLVETQTGTATFQLTGRDYVDAGAYRYRLNKEGNNWVLSNRQGENSTNPNAPSVAPPTAPSVAPPTAPSVAPSTAPSVAPSTAPSVAPPTAPSDAPSTAPSVVPPAAPSDAPTTPIQQVMLSGKSNALVSLRQAQLALVESSFEGLHQRLGELKNGEKGNVWVRNVNRRNEFDDTRTANNSQSSGFKQDIHQLQLGADISLSDHFRLGGFVGNAHSDVDFNSGYGSGKVKSQSLGLYGTYLADNGFYWDNIAKYEYLKSESSYTGARKYNTYTLSSEIGRIYAFGQGWSATPQLQGAWTTISSLVDEDRLSALTARVGVRLAKAIALNGWALQPYAEVNGITTHTNSNKVRVNQYLFDVRESKERVQTAVGVNALWGNHRFGLEGSSSYGKNLDQPYKIQAVYRYSW